MGGSLHRRQAHTHALGRVSQKAANVGTRRAGGGYVTSHQSKQSDRAARPLRRCRVRLMFLFIYSTNCTISRAALDCAAQHRVGLRVVWKLRICHFFASERSLCSECCQHPGVTWQSRSDTRNFRMPFIDLLIFFPLYFSS